MNQAHKIFYLKLIDQKLVTARKRLVQLEQDRNSAESAITSHHDTSRERLEIEVDEQKKYIHELGMFQKFIKASSPKIKIEEGAQFSLELTERNQFLKDLLFAPFNIGFPEIQVTTPKSPLGAAILGKKTGESFLYNTGKIQISGIIKKIE